MDGLPASNAWWHDRKMPDLYEPTSEFLKLLANGLVPLSDDEFGDANLQRLIGFTNDRDVANRDWATFLLSGTDADTPQIKAALHLRLADENQTVQEEALVGLAKRRDASVLPLLNDCLQAGALSKMILEAAAYFAEPALCELLRPLKPWADELSLDHLWEEACANCECGPGSAQGAHVVAPFAKTLTP